MDVDFLTNAAMLQKIFDSFSRNLERFSPFCRVILFRNVALDKFYSSSLLLDFDEVMNQSRVKLPHHSNFTPKVSDANVLSHI